MSLGALRRLLGLESAITLREFLDSRGFGSAELCRAGVWTLFEVPCLGWAAFPGLPDTLVGFLTGLGFGLGPVWVPGLVWQGSWTSVLRLDAFS